MDKKARKRQRNSWISKMKDEMSCNGIIKRVNVSVNFQYEAITIKAIKENVVKTSSKVMGH